MTNESPPFITSLKNGGTKEEAIFALERMWEEKCGLRAEVEKLRDDKRYDGIKWYCINDEPFEYAIQQGPIGTEFVKLINGKCLRRSHLASDDQS